MDFRADLLGTGEILSEAALDDYEFTKSAYFEIREAQINDAEETNALPEGLEDADQVIPAIQRQRGGEGHGGLLFLALSGDHESGPSGGLLRAGRAPGSEIPSADGTSEKLPQQGPT